MPKLNDADAVYLGANEVDRVYLGSNLVWEAAQPLSQPIVNAFSVGGNTITITDLTPSTGTFSRYQMIVYTDPGDPGGGEVVYSTPADDVTTPITFDLDPGFFAGAWVYFQIRAWDVGPVFGPWSPQYSGQN